MKNKIFLFIIIGLISNIFPQTLFRSGIFLLHSTGSCIYWSPDSLATTNIQLEIPAYNLSHNYTGNEAVTMDAIWFPKTPFGNDWFEWHNIFDNNDPNNDIQPYLQDNKIIVIKSCYPSSLIVGEGSPSDTLNPEIKSIYNYKWHWRSIVQVMQQHPENFFAIWTNAPNHGGNGELSHQFCKWAKDTLATGNDPTFGDFPDNVYVFDFFHKLASEGSNWLLPDSLSYWNGTYYENHPGGRATNLVAPLFVQEIFNAVIAYEESLLPVELSSFSASIIGSTVNLNWKTETEVNNYGFDIERKEGTRLSEVGTFEKIGFIQGNGNSNSPKYYSFEDNNLTAGKFSYRLKQIDTDGQFEYSKVIEVDLGAPMKYELSQNYPNPFNPITTIHFSLPESGNVKLILYNTLGQEVRSIVNEYKDSGTHIINFNASGLSSGAFIYKLTAGTFSMTRKMIVIK